MISVEGGFLMGHKRYCSLTMSHSFLLLTAMATALSAQWAAYPTKRVPKDRTGKPNFNAPAPRAADGKPDLSGVWENPPCTKDPCPAGTKEEVLPLAAQFLEIDWGMKEPLPYQPWAKELKEARVRTNGKDNPDAHCQPIGVVQLHTHPYPRRIIQTPGMVVILYEKDGVFRQIYIDGRPLPKDPLPWFYGYSSGKWVGDTLVVETIGLKENWLDFRGSPMTEEAKITERFRRVNYGNLELELTIDDPKAYTKPFTVKINQRIMLGMDLFEFFCAENEKSAEHLK
jgi:hypothetical protein